MPLRYEEIARYLIEYQDRHGYAPTLPEIGRHFGISAQVASVWLERMHHAGMIRRGPGSRAIDTRATRAKLERRLIDTPAPYETNQRNT